MLKNKNVLVTGGTGMVGRELVQLLLKGGAKVRVASLDEPVDFFEEVEFHKVDLTNYENCEMICEGMDYVFHVAGIKGSTKMSQTQPLDYFIPMIRFNTNMMEAAFRRGVKWYLYTSSNGVYAHKDISHEDDVWKTFPSETDKLPGWAKRIGELQAEGYKIQHGWDNISIVRPANVYGKWDNFDLENSMVIPSLIRKGEETGVGGTMNVWGDGLPIRDFIHARDVARGMIFAVENKITEPVNLGCGKGVTIEQIASSIASRFECGIKFDKSKPNGDPIRLLNMERMFSKGFKLSVDIAEGVEETIDWYLSNKDNLDYRYNSFK
jgi:GDP-L-fucose synthase